MNYITTNYTTEECDSMQLIKNQADKINELFLIIKDREDEINALKKEIYIYNGIQNDLNISQKNCFDLKNKVDTYQRCLRESEINYNRILKKCNSLNCCLNNLSNQYVSNTEYNKLKNELNQKNNRIDILIGKDKTNTEKINDLTNKDNKNREKINELKSKLNELTISNKNLLNQNNKLESDNMINLNKLNELQNSIIDKELQKNNLKKDHKNLISKYEEMENNVKKNNSEYNNLKNEILELKEIINQKEKIIEQLKKENEIIPINMNNIIQNYIQEISSLLNILKNNFEIIKKGNMDNIMDISPSNKFNEENSSNNNLSFSYLKDLYFDLLNLNSSLKNIMSTYSRNAIKNLKETYDKNKRYENEIYNLKNELDNLNNKINQYESNENKNVLNNKIKINELSQEKEKLQFQIKSIYSLFNDSYDKITKQYNIISNTDNFPENLKVKKFHKKSNNVKEMILDYEKIVYNFSQYVQILINEKKRLDNLGKKSEEFENDITSLRNELDNIKKNPRNYNSNNNLSNLNLNSSNRICNLIEQLNKKNEENEKLSSNYNLLYSQYHLLLNKKKGNYDPCDPCSNIISYQNTC